MTRLEKIKWLTDNGIYINPKAGTDRVNKKFDKNYTEKEPVVIVSQTLDVDEKRVELEQRKKEQNKKRNQRRNQREKNRKRKAVNTRTKKTVTCYNCQGEFKRSKTVHETLIKHDNMETINARFCKECHIMVVAYMEKRGKQCVKD